MKQIRNVHGGLAWLAGEFAVDKIPGWAWGGNTEYLYYYLYSLARAAGSAGAFGIDDKDWARELCAFLLRTQDADGGWGGKSRSGRQDRPIQTALAALALCRARRPILLAKLVDRGVSFGDARDAANLARWYRRTRRRAVDWRELTPDDPEQAWDAAWVVYVNLTTNADVLLATAEKLRRFVRRGGTVLVQPFAGDEALRNTAMAKLREVFPNFRRQRLAATHPVYTAVHELAPADRDMILGLGNSCRTPVLLLTTDVSGAWHQARFAKDASKFQLAENILAVACDGRELRSKFGSAETKKARPRVRRRIPIARVRHKRDWDVGDGAMANLDRVLIEAISVGLEERPAVDGTTQIQKDIPVLWMTVDEGLSVSPSLRTHLTEYVRAGGMLFVDPANSSEASFRSARKFIQIMVPQRPLTPLKAGSEFLRGTFAGQAGADVRRVRLNRQGTTGSQDKARDALLEAVIIDGRISILLSRYGVTCALADVPCYGRVGLAIDDAKRLAANIVLYAVTRPRR